MVPDVWVYRTAAGCAAQRRSDGPDQPIDRL